MGKLEKKCCKYYHNLPFPKDVLGEDDTELIYYLWVPGSRVKKPPPPPHSSKSASSVRGSLPGEPEFTDEEMRAALANMVDSQDIHELFESRASGGTINEKDAIEIARKLGLAPSKADEKQIVDMYGGKLTFSGFEEFCARCVHLEDSEDEISKIFGYFDVSQRGKLTVDQVKTILTSFGEPLDDDEIGFALNNFTDSDMVDYKEFVSKILKK